MASCLSSSPDSKGFIKSYSFKDCTFSYDGDQTPIFREMTLELPLGINCLVTGPLRSGQSTFLRLLAVLIQPQKGSVFINGEDTTEMSFEEFLPYRRKIGYSFDYGGLFANRTLLDNLTLPLVYHKICSPEDALNIATGLCQRFHFTNQANLRPAMVSGALRKLVCILRAFIAKPEMLIMDDPFIGLDSQNAQSLINLVKERRQIGELKHVFFTSRDDVWAHQLGYEPLVVENCRVRFEPGKVA